jgi:hypothetical protein
VSEQHQWRPGDGVVFDVTAPQGWARAPVWDPRFALDEYKWATHLVDTVHVPTNTILKVVLF